MDLRELLHKHMNWTKFVQERVQRWAFVDIVINIVESPKRQGVS
jgi:hypothetical protein